MHAHFLDPFKSLNSPIHTLDPRIKLLLVLVYIVTVALIPVGAWPVYLLLLALIISVEVLSELGLKYIHQRALLALPFILAALPVIFTSGKTVLLSFPIGPWSLTAYQEGLVRFISVGLKSWISVQAAIVLASSTTFPDLLLAMRAIHIPRLLVAMVSLMWRYLSVLVDEAMRLMRARASRSGTRIKHGHRASLVWRAKVTGGMAGSLFLRAFERSDRIYMSMVSRGYDGEIRALPMPSLRPVDWVIFVMGLVTFSLLLAAGFLFWS